jgi:pyruvate dehydrogenase E2 component (dihydrolipoamide acetyltransferase)
MTVLLAKAAAMALAQHPVVNASCRDGKSLTYNSNINIAVAVAIDGGLITPVLQDADKVSKILVLNAPMLFCYKLQHRSSLNNI